MSGSTGIDETACPTGCQLFGASVSAHGPNYYGLDPVAAHPPVQEYWRVMSGIFIGRYFPVADKTQRNPVLEPPLSGAPLPLLPTK